MKNQENISNFQLAVLFQISMTGSAIVNIPQPVIAAAKNAAWISLMLASGISFLGLACILYLHRKYPGMTFVEYAREAVGTWPAVIIAVLFLSVPLILLPNIVFDISSFFKVTVMENTPIAVINFLFFLLAALTVQAGIEVMARLFTLLVFGMFCTIIVVLLLVSPLYHPEYLAPLFPNGFKPVLHGAFLASSFPFSDVVLLSMLLPFARMGEDKKTGRLLYGSLLVTVISLMLVTVCSIMTMGPIAGTAKYSVFQLARLISVQEIIERVEMLIAIALIVASYMKATIILFVLTIGVSKLLHLQNYRNIVFPLAFTALLLSDTMYKGSTDFLKNVSLARPLMSFSLFIVPLLFITLVTLFKRKTVKTTD